MEVETKVLAPQSPSSRILGKLAKRYELPDSLSVCCYCPRHLMTCWVARGPAFPSMKVCDSLHIPCPNNAKKQKQGLGVLAVLNEWQLRGPALCLVYWEQIAILQAWIRAWAESAVLLLQRCFDGARKGEACSCTELWATFKNYP